MLMPSIFRNDLFDGFFNDFDFAWPERMPQRRPAPMMKTDVKETKTGYELHIDLPGYKKDDVAADLKDGYLTITAKTDTNKDQKDDDGKYLRRERYYGSCQRSYYVGEEVTEEDIKAKFENGTLMITIPKKEAQPKVEETKHIMIEG